MELRVAVYCKIREENVFSYYGKKKPRYGVSKRISYREEIKIEKRMVKVKMSDISLLNGKVHISSFHLKKNSPIDIAPHPTILV